VIIDSHAHLDDPRFAADLEEVLARAQQAGVGHIVTIGTGLESSRKVIDLARRHPDLVSATVGIHPHDARLADEPALTELERLAREPGVAAVGEIGLDYHYDHSPREAQRAAFEAQIQLALRVGLPVVVHCRKAYSDALPILEKRCNDGLRGVAHCFSGTWADAERLLGMGFFISIAGPVTFPNASALRGVAQRISLDRLLVETDCPYLAPQACRGRRNEPAYVAHVADALAQLRRVEPGEIGRKTAENAVRLFSLSVSR
jgi:TatD DNase family protein